MRSGKGRKEDTGPEVYVAFRPRFEQIWLESRKSDATMLAIASHVLKSKRPLHKAKPSQVPAIIAHVGAESTKLRIFTVPIRNKNTRIAYY